MTNFSTSPEQKLRLDGLSTADILPFPANGAHPPRHLNGHAPPAAGHNSGTTAFDAIVDENLRRGLYVTQRDVLINCIRDVRLSPRHRLVLAAIIEHTNTRTGLAYPGRKALAQKTTWYDPAQDWAERHYTEPGIGKTISELIDFGYLAWAKRAPDGGGRALSHYTIIRPTAEELQTEITAYIMEIRQRGPQTLPDFKGQQGDVTPVGNVTHGGDVTPVGNIRKADVTPVVSADVTPVVPTGTSRERTSSTAAASNEAARATLPLGDEPAQQALKEPGTKSSKKRAAPRTLIAPDWRPSDSMIAWVRERWVATDRQIATEAEKFRENHKGKGNAMADWSATWRTWWLQGYHKIARRPDSQSAADAGAGADLDAAYEQIRRDREGSQ